MPFEESIRVTSLFFSVFLYLRDLRFRTSVDRHTPITSAYIGRMIIYIGFLIYCHSERIKWGNVSFVFCLLEKRVASSSMFLLSILMLSIASFVWRNLCDYLNAKVKCVWWWKIANGETVKVYNAFKAWNYKEFININKLEY